MNPLKKSRSFITFTIFCLSMACPMSAFSQDFGKTIDVAGRQRMLTQKMTKEFFCIQRGVHPEIARADLGGSMNLFETSLNALKEGNVDIGVQKPPADSVSATLNEVTTQWEQFKPILTIAQEGGTPTDEQIQFITNNNVKLLKTCHAAVVGYVKATSDGGSGANQVLNVAGKQRMLIQRLAKEVFLASSSIDVEANKERSLKTIEVFEKAIQDLIVGNPDIGVPPNSSPKCVEMLLMAKDKWTQYRVLIRRILASDGLQSRLMKRMYRESNEILREMHAIVQFIQKESKKQA